MICFLKQPYEAYPAIIQPSQQIIYENMPTPQIINQPYNINQKQEESEEEQQIIRPKVL